MKINLFEDECVDELFPAIAARPAYAIQCAAKRLIDWVQDLNQPLFGIVRPHLRTIQELDFPMIEEWDGKNEDSTLFVNASTVPSRKNFEVLKSIVDRNRFGVVHAGERIAAALIPGDVKGDRRHQNGILSRQYFATRNISELNALGSELDLFHYPHDIVRFNLETINDNLAYIIATRSLTEVRDGVFVAKGAQLGEHIVCDTSAGPIVVDENAKIGPYTFLSGPAYIGPNSKVIEHSAIKDAVSLGHTTKIGGEVEASIIEPYTNKQHHGFLGHSYLGSWINLGAGTCNSDLKNTYGEVKIEYPRINGVGSKVTTNMQFVGCIMGDYSKSAINTGIFTGKVVGLCSMLYGFVTTNVPSFVNYARLFGQVTEMPPEVMISTQKRMFARRNVKQRPCDIQLINDLYGITRNERQIAGEPLAL